MGILELFGPRCRPAVRCSFHTAPDPFGGFSTARLLGIVVAPSECVSQSRPTATFSSAAHSGSDPRLPTDEMRRRNPNGIPTSNPRPFLVVLHVAAEFLRRRESVTLYL